jgi:acyl carrier protein
MVQSLTDVTQIVGAAWRDVLRLPSVNDGDNFLDLGGNSLRAGEISARLLRDLGVEIPVDVVLSEETFGAFVTRVNERLAEGSTE